MRHLNPRAALVGIGELKPQRRTEGISTMEMLMHSDMVFWVLWRGSTLNDECKAQAT